MNTFRYLERFPGSIDTAIAHGLVPTRLAAQARLYRITGEIAAWRSFLAANPKASPGFDDKLMKPYADFPPNQPAGGTNFKDPYLYNLRFYRWKELALSLGVSGDVAAIPSDHTDFGEFVLNDPSVLAPERTAFSLADEPTIEMQRYISARDFFGMNPDQLSFSIGCRPFLASLATNDWGFSVTALAGIPWLPCSAFARGWSEAEVTKLRFRKNVNVTPNQPDLEVIATALDRQNTRIYLFLSQFDPITPPAQGVWFQKAFKRHLGSKAHFEVLPNSGHDGYSIEKRVLEVVAEVQAALAATVPAP